MTDILELARKSGATWGNEADQLFMPVSALHKFTEAVRQEERERAEQDARRWRWWRTHTLMRLNQFGGNWRVSTPDAVLTEWLPSADEAVDAAILAQPEQGGTHANPT